MKINDNERANLPALNLIKYMVETVTSF